MQKHPTPREPGRRRVNNRPRWGVKRVLLTTLAGGGALALGYMLAFGQMGESFRDGLATRALTLTASLGYRVDNILVVGRTHTDSDVIKALVARNRGDAMFGFDPNEVRADLQKISWVQDANVRRHLPNTIYIELSERTPIALWQQAGKVQVIDRTGLVLTPDVRAFSDLPLVVGAGAAENAATFLDQLEAEPELARQIEAAMWVGNRRWDLALKNNIIVKLPEDNVGLALKKLADANERDQLFGKDIAGIDLREDDRFVIRTKPGGVEEYKASFTGKPATGDDI